MSIPTQPDRPPAPDLPDQIRAWGDAVMAGAPHAVTADEARRADGPGAHPRRGGGGRWLVAAAVLAVLVAGGAVVALTRPDPPDRVATRGQPADPGSPPVSFEVLGVGRWPAHDDPSQQVATNPARLDWLWTAVGLDPPVPEVDWERQVVVALTVPHGACQRELARIDRDGDRLWARFVQPEGGCALPLAESYVVALERAAVGDRFTLVLPGEPSATGDGPEVEVPIDVSAIEQLSSIPPLPVAVALGPNGAVAWRAVQAAGFAPAGGPTYLGDESTGPGLALTLPDATPVRLTWTVPDPSAPADVREGLGPEVTTHVTADGGTVTSGVLDGTTPAVRFSCDGVRYQIDGAHQVDGAALTVDRLAPVASALSGALGCTPVRTDAPTACIGLPGDPAACTETD